MKKWLVSGFCNPIEVNVIQQAGITYVENYEELKEREKVLKLTK